VDLPLFLASLSKLLDGALVPVLLAAGVAVVMLTWRRGRDLVHSSMQFGAVGIDELAARLQAGEFARIDSTQVFIVRKPIVDNAIACILEQNRRIKVVGNRLVILLLNPGWANAHSSSLDIELKEYPGGLWVINAEHGFMVEPNVPRIMRSAASQSNGRFVFHTEETFFVVAHELVLSSPKRRMPPWQRHLFAFMSRNVLPGPDYLGIPPERLLVYNWMLRV
jgi:KUP system potassium uptake protein